MPKKCLSCRHEYQASLPSCPKCGSRESMGTGSSIQDIDALFSNADVQRASASHSQKGGEFFTRGDFRSAAAEFRAALQADPSSANDHENLGVALCKLGDYSTAIPSLQKALDLQPSKQTAKKFLEEAKGHTKPSAPPPQIAAAGVVSTKELNDAVERGDAAAVQTLLANGADVNAKKNDGWTALLLASRNGNLEVVQALLTNGANVNAQSTYGWTALLLASKQKHRQVVQALLAKGADVNARDKTGETALMWASRFGDREMVQMLLAKGADVNSKTINGWTALIAASSSGHREVVQMLLAKGAKAPLPSSEGLILVKRLIRESSGARDFHRRATEAGLITIGEGIMGLTMEGLGCRLIFSVLKSRGPDKIWSLVIREGEQPSVALVDEGRITF